MDLLLNDLSLHGQFSDITTFQEAIHRVVSMRNLARSFGREVYSHRNIRYGLVNPNASLPQALKRLPKDQIRSISQWLTKHGPFWEDFALHDSDLYMDFREEVVTDTAVGEAAYCMAKGISRGLISFNPSNWCFSPICVRVVSDSETEVFVPNYWGIPELRCALQEAEPPITSWEQMERVSRRAFQRLSFSCESFSFLSGQPFALGAADRILVRLRTLDVLVGSVDARGQRTAEGHRIYNEHFTGQKAWFSDSSETEKNEFEKKLTFLGPQGTPLFCTWHGKVNTPPYRIHFAWPERPGDPLYVVYIGWKITLR